jgi:hypothetical protein
MTWLPFLGAGTFLSFSLGLGLRLLWRARLAGGLPEASIGVAFIAAGCFGAGLQLMAQTPGLLTVPGAWTAMAAGKLCIHVGAICQALFTWRVFRPTEEWARNLFVGLVAGLVGVTLGYGFEGVLGDPAYSGIWFWCESGVHLVAIGWGSVESLGYWDKMRRRVRLGLADPVVANRFLLWAVAIGAGVLALLLGPVIHIVGANSPYTLALVSWAATLGLVSIVGYGLTFFPPRSYRRWLEQHAPIAS